MRRVNQSFRNYAAKLISVYSSYFGALQVGQAALQALRFKLLCAKKVKIYRLSVPQSQSQSRAAVEHEIRRR